MIFMKPITPFNSILKIMVFFFFQNALFTLNTYLIMAEQATLAPAFPAGCEVKSSVPW